MDIGVIVLAAGKSERLGYPKQLLKYGTSNLLNHSLQIAGEIAGLNTVLVLGANAAIIFPQLQALGATIVQNPDWEEGIASSIRMGLLAFISMQPSADGVIFMVCDQPYISSSLLEKLVLSARNSKKGIIASEYEQILGTPALFKKYYFKDLLNLQGTDGAKKLFSLYPQDIEHIPFEMGYIDIDTQQDYDSLTSVISKDKPSV